MRVRVSPSAPRDSILNLKDFNFHLPKQLIASTPTEERGRSQLLVLRNKSYDQYSFNDLKKLLNPGDLLVLNNTKVLLARLNCFKSTGAKVEIMVERILNDYHVSALTKSNVKLKEGDEILINHEGITATLEKKEEHLSYFVFSSPVKEVLDQYGMVPLPPYIKRRSNKSDLTRYQTVYADPSKQNSVASPTAGLHFELDHLEDLRKEGINFINVTLDIGFGTFQPIKEDNIKNHVIHKEKIEVTTEAVQKILKTKLRGSKVIAVGTTVLRCLESLSKINNGTLKAFTGETDIFIYPGFKFKVVDALITNFHLPSSSLFILVCAFGGTKRMQAAYKHAIQKEYRFFSYGDAMFISSNTS